ncbi:hypothetical protein ANCCEY_04595 [Ancylostoma ceylanicum]|uniref:ISXO2-like transposase domain-containing protein n=1 Tax=Ancylostoma ceylanicum TaxID=53326 RepID=A0A0D6LYS6_9BILA|nr:hypothetical protein ANCCEY_04595 [Ancylostoma ceylanicum]
MREKGMVVTRTTLRRLEEELRCLREHLDGRGRIRKLASGDSAARLASLAILPAQNKIVKNPKCGEFGRIVEIDETCVTKKKYNRGRWVLRHQWLSGRYERGRGKFFLILVRRDATFLRLVKYIGTSIVSDCWGAYNRISSLLQEYRHITFNYLVNFADPTTDAHTQNIECHWQTFKNLANRRSGVNNRRYRNYFSDFRWRQRCKSPVELYNLFIDDEVIDITVQGANRYRANKDEAFVLTDNLEMKQFLSIIIQMDFIHLPKLEDYWSTNVEIEGNSICMSNAKIEILVDNEITSSRLQ